MFSDWLPYWLQEGKKYELHFKFIKIAAFEEETCHFCKENLTHYKLLGKDLDCTPCYIILVEERDGLKHSDIWLGSGEEIKSFFTTYVFWGRK